MLTPEYSKDTCAGSLEDGEPARLVTMTVAMAGPFPNRPLMVSVLFAFV